MHILIIPSWFPRHKKDISGIFFKEQAEALAKVCKKISVLNIVNYPKRYKYIIQVLRTKNYTENNVNVFWVKFFNFSKLFKHNNETELKIAIKWLKKYITKNGKPDVIHAHSVFNGGIIANKLSEEFNIPFVITEHSTLYSRNLLSFNQLEKAKNIFTSASKAIFVSTSLRKTIENKINITLNNSICIPNILNSQFTSLSPENKNNDFIFLNVAMLHPKKNQELLIRSFYELYKNYKNINLKIAGYGDEKDRLEELINELGLENKVFLLGKLNRVEVLKALSQCDAFVLSSEIETFGVVVIEALSQGKPVISTKCGGPEDIINSTNGYLVENNSVKEMTVAMEKMIKNISSFDKDIISKQCNEQYGEIGVTTSLLKVYKSLINSIEGSNS